MSELELEFGDGSWEQAYPLVRSTLIALHKDINGNGKPGLKEDMNTLKAYGQATLFWIRGIFGLLLAGGGLATIYMVWHH